MRTSTISPEFEVVIPEDVRQRLGLLPGQKLHVFTFDHRIEMVPERRAAELRGTMKGIGTERDEDEDRY